MIATVSEHERDAARKRQSRAQERDIEIPAVANPARRAQAEADIYFALTTYFPEKFTTEFTKDQRDMIEAILYRARHGGDQAIAAPRGEGKTTITEAVVIMCLLFGVLKFPLIVSATGPDAKRILSNIKYELECNDHLAEDFPEVCACVRALEGAPQRANMQTVGGRRTMIRWADDYIIFPEVEGSPSSGSILSARGGDAAIRGVRYRNTRPDMVVVDDPETRESADSEIQTTKRCTILEQDIAGLGGPGQRVARVMLCTIMKKGCVADQYTDPKSKPSWNGKRYKLIETMPDAEDMWAEYIIRRQTGQESGNDRDGRDAHKFYEDNREAMDAGAVLSNPNRYIKDLLPDGQPSEISALQHCYNIIADRGWASFATEYQNEPPDDEGPQESGISAGLVRSRTNGRAKGIVPLDAIALTAHIDVGKRACHYCVTAWYSSAVGYVVDYGVQDVYNADERGPEKAIEAALHQWRDDNQYTPYVDENGRPRRLDLVLVDAGNWDTTIYRFCAAAGRPFQAAMGIGGQLGKASFRTPQSAKQGDHWYMAKKPDGTLVVNMDSDYWKRWTHDRFITQPLDDGGRQKPGTLTLFGSEQKHHVAYAAHIVAEVEEEEFIRGKGVQRRWRQVNKNNHWLDATYGACVAASICGVKLLPPTGPQRSRKVKISGSWWGKK